jgi:hypothetical protein
LSFIGLVELGKFLMKFKFSKLKIYFVLFLIPSFVFWSSGILKETILVSLLGILLNQTHEFFNEKKSLIKLFIILCCVLLMSVLKVYVLVCFLPLIAYLILQKFLIFKQRNYLPLLLCIGILTIILIVFREINPVNLIVNKQHNFINLAESIDARSKIDIPYLDGSFWNLVQAVPIAFINTSFRPFPMDLNSLMIVLPFLENVFLILLIIVFITQKRTTVFYQNQKILCIYFGLVIFFLFSLIGLTTPIIGAIVRYKVPVLPFLYIIVLSLIDFNAFSRFSLYQKLKIKIAKYL